MITKENAQKPIAVCFDARMISHSGIGTQVYNVLKLLAKEKNIRLRLLGKPEQFRVLLPAFDGSTETFLAPIYSPKEQLFFPKPEPDEILHCPHYNAPLRYLDRSVVVVHDLIHLQSSEFSKPHYRLYAWLLLFFVARCARQIVTVSETTRLELIRRFPKAAGKTRVIYNGINHQLFRPPQAAKARAFCKKYSLPRKFLLSVGIGKKHKNIDFVINAMAPLWKSGRLKLPLVLAGTGGRLPDYIDEAVKATQTRERLIVLPYLEEAELPLLYGSAHLFLFPSLLEGFGFPMIEAMASGCPVLASHASCLPEIGADAARYFDPHDAKDFQDKLLEVLDAKEDLLRKKMRKSGTKRAKDFSWETHAEQLIQLYKDIHNERHK